MVSLIKGLTISPLDKRVYDNSFLNYHINFHKYIPQLYFLTTIKEKLNRIDIINTYINKKFISNINKIIYLEISCNDNERFDNVRLPLSKKIGVELAKSNGIRLDVF